MLTQCSELAKAKADHMATLIMGLTPYMRLEVRRVMQRRSACQAPLYVATALLDKAAVGDDYDN